MGTVLAKAIIKKGYLVLMQSKISIKQANEQQVMHQKQEGALPGRAIAEAGILVKEIGHDGENKVVGQI